MCTHFGKSNYGEEGFTLGKLIGNYETPEKKLDERSPFQN